MAEAVRTFIEHIPGNELPQTAGVGVTVSVTIELRSLIDGLKAGRSTTGGGISAFEVRRTACEQAILPMVSTATPLDCGREKRLFNRASCAPPKAAMEAAVVPAAPRHRPGASATTFENGGPKAAQPTSTTWC